MTMTVDHGTRSATIKALSMRAARCLVIARELADDTGEVPGGQPALARAMGTQMRNVRYALGELEDRRLARRVGTHRVFVGGTASAALDGQIEPPALQQRWRSDRRRFRTEPDARNPGAGTNPEFRHLRARMGGLERALAVAKAKNDEAATLLAKFDGRSLDATPAVAAMRADLLHAADCGDPDCNRCVRIVDTLEEEEGPYASHREVSERLARGGLAERAGRIAVSALRAREQRDLVAAMQAMDLVIAGDFKQAEIVLARMEDR
jgi:hypothetical protein